jgi:hypothetical protein
VVAVELGVVQVDLLLQVELAAEVMVTGIMEIFKLDLQIQVVEVVLLGLTMWVLLVQMVDLELLF